MPVLLSCCPVGRLLALIPLVQSWVAWSTSKPLCSLRSVFCELNSIIQREVQVGLRGIALFNEGLYVRFSSLCGGYLWSDINRLRSSPSNVLSSNNARWVKCKSIRNIWTTFPWKYTGFAKLQAQGLAKCNSGFAKPKMFGEDLKKVDRTLNAFNSVIFIIILSPAQPQAFKCMGFKRFICWINLAIHNKLRFFSKWMFTESWNFVTNGWKQHLHFIGPRRCTYRFKLPTKWNTLRLYVLQLHIRRSTGFSFFQQQASRLEGLQVCLCCGGNVKRWNTSYYRLHKDFPHLAGPGKGSLILKEGCPVWTRETKIQKQSLGFKCVKI